MRRAGTQDDPNKPPFDSQENAWESWEFSGYAATTEGWVVTASGGSVSVGGAASADLRNPGGLEFLAGTVAGNYAGLRRSVTALSLGGGAMRLRATVNIPVLPTAADDFLLEWGLGDLNASPVADGALLALSAQSGAARWTLETRDSGVGNTSTPLAIVPQAGRQTLDVHVSADAGAAWAEIRQPSGAFERSQDVTATIPSGTADTTGTRIFLGWLAGAANPLVTLEYADVFQRFTSGRVG